MVVITYGLLWMNKESEDSFWRELEEVVDCVCVRLARGSEDRTKRMEQTPFDSPILYMKEGTYLTSVHLEGVRTPEGTLKNIGKKGTARVWIKSLGWTEQRGNVKWRAQGAWRIYLLVCVKPRVTNIRGMARLAGWGFLKNDDVQCPWANLESAARFPCAEHKR